jgi:hypothetical protein
MLQVGAMGIEEEEEEEEEELYCNKIRDLKFSAWFTFSYEHTRRPTRYEG